MKIKHRGCVGKDAMIYAANFGNVEIIQLLLSKGANIDVQDKTGNSPLMMAARYDIFERQFLYLKKMHRLILHCSIKYRNTNV